MTAAEPSEPTLHQKLVWLSFFRIITVTVLLGGTAMLSWQTHGDAEGALAPIYATVIGVYAASIASSVALRRRAALAAVAYAQIALDVAVAAAVVSVTGRGDSVFVILFSLAVVNGAVLLFRRGAAVATALAVGGYLVVVGYGGPAPRPATLFAHVAAFAATGALAAYLADQLRSAGERLAASESDLATITALHESIVQSLTSGLVTLDPAGRVTYMNAAGEQMTGVLLASVRGRPLAELVPFQGGVGRGELEHVNARRERLRIGYSSFPLLGRGGARLGLAVIFQDLTRLRAMEEAVLRSARLADLGRVAAGLAHELRNPLASMSGSVELLRAQAAADADERRLLDIVLREAARLDQLVAEFLSFARPPPLRRVPVDLAGLLDETLRVFEHDPAARGLVLVRDLAPATVRCDPDRVRQVAWNLLRNAAQAAAEARDGAAAAGRIQVSCAAEPGGVRFAVADDGPGIPEAERERIFLPFHTTKTGGTGLGLATVHRIVDEHGGRIEVESSPGRGARFVVHLAGAEPVDAAEG